MGNYGGGLFIQESTDLTIQETTIRYNNSTGANTRGGGVYILVGSSGLITQSLVSHNQADFGAGLFIDNSTLTIQNSLIWDNTAADSGGGLYSDNSDITLINSTISQNSADFGAAVYAKSDSDVSFFHTTVMSNVASAYGVIQHEEDSAFRFGQTILAYNAPNNCDEQNSDLNNSGYNVDDDDTCSLGGSNGQVNVDPLLQGLAENNGGTAGVIGHTQVISSHAVPSDSNAFDYIPYNSNGCGTTYTTDQRGVARPQDPFQNCTVGAFEYVGDRVPVTTADNYALDANTTLTVAASGVLANDSDPLSRTLSAVIETAPSDGTVDLVADGSFTYTPTTDFVGTDLFTYAADNGIYTGTAVVTLTVSGGNCHVYNDGATYGSFDAGAVQEAIDEATAGDTLKIAGTCAGVETVASENQTGYISKTVTLEGGYDGVTWDKSAYTTTYTTTLSADDNGRVIYIAPSTTATLTHLILRDGAATDGGGVYMAADSSLSVISSTLTSNQATNDGGAIYATSADMLQISGSLIDDNIAYGSAAGIYVDMTDAVSITHSVISNNQNTLGQDIIHITGNQTEFQLLGSTIEGNTADTGGILVVYSGRSTLENSTISDNEIFQNGVIEGGAVYAAGGEITLTHTTIVSNTGIEGLVSNGSTPINLAHTIIAHHGEDDCVDVNVTATYSLDSDGSCGLTGSGGNLSSSDPLLDPLAANSGLTAGATGESTINTHAASAASPIIDLVPYGANGCGTTTVVTDQRGVTRPQDPGAYCTAGAFEYVGDRVPVAAADRYDVAPNTALTVAASGVLENDSNPLSRSLSATLETAPSNGVLALAADGSFVYTPTTDFSGTDLFTYTADSGTYTDTAVVTIMVGDLSCAVYNDGALYETVDAYAVQEGIDEATAGDTLKIAGTCIGATETDGTDQTAYISKTLTLAGGYTTTNWSTAGGYTTTLDANAQGRSVFVTNNAAVTLTSLIMLNGYIPDYSVQGGGIFANDDTELNLIDTVLSTGDTFSQTDSNATISGLGIYMGENGVLKIDSSEISENRALVASLGRGGGIYLESYAQLYMVNSVVSHNELMEADEYTFHPMRGGGIYASNDTILEITSSDISHNKMIDNPGPAAVSLYGGGMYISVGTAFTLTNSSVTYNEASSYAGIFLNNVDRSTLTNSTISHNSGGRGVSISGASSVATLTHMTIFDNEDGGASMSGLTLTLYNTLIAGNGGNNCSGTMVDGGYNLDDDDSCGLSATGSLTMTDALLETLADNGGETQTNGLPSNSPAVDQIPHGTNGCGTDYTTDQRGVVRPQDSNCDIGAFEYVDYTPVPIADSYEVLRNSTLMVTAPGVLENDSDPFTQTLSAVIETMPSNGALALAADGSFIYTPTTDFVGTDLFTYTADNGTYTDTAVVTLTVSDGDCHVYNDGTTYDSLGAEAVQQAIDEATAGDTLKIAGTCTGVQARNSVTQTGYITKSLTLQGGYTTTNWATSGGYTTTIDADQSGRALYITGTVTVTLTDLVFQNGQSDHGGAILASDTTLIISGATFSDNRAATSGSDGGAIELNTGALTITDTTFADNYAEDKGGALSVDSATVTITNSHFISNTADTDDGGAIRLTSANGTIKNSTFSDNSSGDRGGAVRLYETELVLDQNSLSDNYAADDGGAVSAENGSILTLTNSIFSDNYAADQGGALNVYSSTFTITDSQFISNTANSNDGGAIRTNEASGTIESNTFTHNESGNNGGAIRLYSSQLLLDQNTLSDNYAADSGGAVAVEGASTITATDNLLYNNTADSSGGAFYISSSFASDISNNEIYENFADGLGGGLYLTSSSGEVSHNTVTTNTSNTSRGGGISVVSSDGITVTQNTVDHNTSAIDGGGIYFLSSSGTISHNTVTSNTTHTSNGGGIAILSSSAISVSQNIVRYNQARSLGGGIYFESSSGEISHNTVTTNTSTGSGGGGIMAVWSNELEIDQNTIQGNQADRRGGGIYIYGSVVTTTISSNLIENNLARDTDTDEADTKHGGGVAILESSAVALSQNTIISNSAFTHGGGLYVQNSPLSSRQ